MNVSEYTSHIDVFGNIEEKKKERKKETNKQKRKKGLILLALPLFLTLSRAGEKWSGMCDMSVWFIMQRTKWLSRIGTGRVGVSAKIPVWHKKGVGNAVVDKCFSVCVCKIVSYYADM